MKPPKPDDQRRSELMARVRQRGTAAEVAVAIVLRGLGHRYRLNVRRLPGSPDFANSTRRWAVFVHGCFWHHHTGCKRATIPKANETFWREKFAANRKRDANAVQRLRAARFRVALIWECQTFDVDRLGSRLSKVLESCGPDVAEAIDHRGIVINVTGKRRRRLGR